MRDLRFLLAYGQRDAETTPLRGYFSFLGMKKGITRFVQCKRGALTAPLLFPSLKRNVCGLRAIQLISLIRYILLVFFVAIFYLSTLNYILKPL